ncbi:hybrid sensor histidine kinase/response regulator [Sphingomonas spermidinifaciens]|uniref:histidine kinase n=1 Tax=Sphingomonas spermidinifaciens TaxID=1141889 RepID=A0A2A4B652_9SPHN|nr:ATP-binding protein [Sphingomonas spermidinifaciens]PCD03560.1 hybrid sensor histidine kinase/response regulator [Sphingomonas spermidinifaciens]
MATSPLSPPDADTTRQSLLIAAAAGTAAAIVILWMIGDWRLAAGFVAAGLVMAGGVLAFARLSSRRAAAAPVQDWALAHALADASAGALAVTDRSGVLVCANDAYRRLFDGLPTPPSVPLDADGEGRLGGAGRAAWRDGRGEVAGLAQRGRLLDAVIARAGEDMLVWHFTTASAEGAATGDALPALVSAVAGRPGERLGAAGVMAVVIQPDGRIEAANRVFTARALGKAEGNVEGRDFARLMLAEPSGHVRFEREGEAGNPLRLIQLPLGEGAEAPLALALIDEEDAGLPAGLGDDVAAHVRALVGLLPIGLAMVDREGRFVHFNASFAAATAVNAAAPPLYPGDLVVREDKAALADAVRRFSGGAAHVADMQVRLAARPDEPVALTLAGARGLGDAAVILCLKESGEEGQLKRQVAQATKMQAVGQLAGGVAHDFNNILTAIIGHCDLMLMRHSPGDSDHDDIQQVRANANRAAALTRQLLAFSRQQTLRPQVLQLPDVVSEVSNLLTRLLGETVRLEVKHGRGLGAVRADPGQLEQVIVNLAVNARDAMVAANPKGGGTLTIETLAVGRAAVKRMDDDVLPVGDYAVLRITDTGTGIPADILPKIFEPFFTTKEVGKGTGLGLSTVYGIVKQSGGYIFAESPPGQGACFTIYLPVYSAAEAPAPKATPKPVKRAAGWGTGTVVLVEDEAMVRAVAERALVRQGYKVLTAENGEAALELIAACERPDLLVSDVVMPMMDGPTMVAKVRERYPDLPILFMSGYAEEQLRRSIDLDNVAFLPKPFSVQQLTEAVGSVMGAA